jgi:iron complex outermembrane recepter protein
MVMLYGTACRIRPRLPDAIRAGAPKKETGEGDFPVIAARPAACALLLCACGAGAETTLPQVSVTTTRTEAAPFDVPASVDVIEGERLRDAARPEVQLSEGLALVPGVTARDRQNYAQDLQLSIRGFGARSTFGVRGVRLYVDGIPATMPDGQGQLSHFDLSSASHVEVLRGPFSALYGNSSGGVLQLFTERGQGRPTVTGSVAVGSDGLFKPGVRVTGASGKLGYTLSANHLESDGPREHSAVRRDLGNARLDWQGLGGDWMLAANALNMHADDPLGLTRAQFDADPRSVDAAALTFNTRKTVRQGQLGLTHDRPLGAGQSVRLMVYGGERSTEQYQAIPTGPQASPLHPGGVIDLHRAYGGADLRWTWVRGTTQLVAGLAYDKLVEDRRGWLNFVGSTLGVKGALRRDEDNDVHNLDPYVQAVWKPAPAWTVVAGVRQSHVRFESDDQFIVGTNRDDSGSVRYRRVLPAAGATYAVSEALHAYAAWGAGFETPTFNELAYRPDGTAGLNPGLRPSRSRNVEVGLKGRTPAPPGWRTQWSAALFQVGTKDEIVTQTNTGGRSTFQNAGATRRRGLELAWSAALPPAWTVQFAHTWLDARYRDSFRSCTASPCASPNLVIPAGNRIPGVARSFSAAELVWRAPQGWRAGAEVRRSSRVFVNDANTDAAGSWWTAAAHVGYLWNLGAWQVDAAARVDNLFDRRYAGSVIVNEGNGRFFEPAPGRQFTFKLAVSHPL